jgi:hypothetical protein
MDHDADNDSQRKSSDRLSAIKSAAEGYQHLVLLTENAQQLRTLSRILASSALGLGCVTHRSDWLIRFD